MLAQVESKRVSCTWYWTSSRDKRTSFVDVEWRPNQKPQTQLFLYNVFSDHKTTTKKHSGHTAESTATFEHSTAACGPQAS